MTVPPIVSRLDATAITSLALHGNAIAIMAVTYSFFMLPPHLAALDVTFVPSDEHIAAFVGDNGLVRKLGGLPTLYSFTVRVDTPARSFQSTSTFQSDLWRQLVSRLHANYPPGLKQLAFKTHSAACLPEVTSLEGAPRALTSAEEFA